MTLPSATSKGFWFTTGRRHAVYSLKKKDDKYMEKFRELFDKRDKGEITQEECNRFYEELDNEWLNAAEQLYDEEFGTQSEEKNFAAPNFAIA